MIIDQKATVRTTVIPEINPVFDHTSSKQNRIGGNSRILSFPDDKYRYTILSGDSCNGDLLFNGNPADPFWLLLSVARETSQ